MSFLNPVNEPVLRFSSTDANAPQISYNARVSGDIKAVLKACLVTGYGSKEGAGWSIVNEVNHVAEFMSPSAAMSDYRLGIDDTSASSTTWYYQYNNQIQNPNENSLSKSFSWIATADANAEKNGWELIVTERGLYFVERVYNNPIAGVMARLTFFGQIKSALFEQGGINIGFWCAGYASPSFSPYNVFNSSTQIRSHYKLDSYSNLRFMSANMPIIESSLVASNSASVDLVSEMYLFANRNFVASQPGFLLSTHNSTERLIGVYTDNFNSRPVMHVCVGIASGDSDQSSKTSTLVFIYLDYWEY